MGDCEKNICNKTPPFYVLLPTCVEAEYNVFLKNLRVAVNRKTVKDSNLDYALKSGLAGDIFSIRAYDTSVNWKELHSEKQQIRQSKLLGYWAINNYPSLGKKLFGKSYIAPERGSIMVKDKENSYLMNADEVDAFIFPKMKLHVVELSVSEGTWDKLKYFVIAPIATIDKHNVTKLSAKMKSFDIDNDYLENCWKALKDGSSVPPLGSSIELLMNKQISSVALEMEVETSREVEVETSREVAVETSREVEVATSGEMEVASCAMEEHPISRSGQPSAKRARLDCIATDSAESFGDLTNDSLRVVLMEIRQNVCNLTKSFDPTLAEHHNGPESLHIMIMKQKDVEIARLKLLTEEFQKEIDSLKIENSSLKGQNVNNVSLIKAFQKGVEASSKLQMKFEDDLVASVELNNNYKETIAQYENRIEMLQAEVPKDKTVESELQKQIQNLNLRSTKAEKSVVEMAEKNENLEQELREWKEMEQKARDGYKKLEETLNHLKDRNVTTESALKNQVQMLVNSLAEAENTNSEMAERNRKLDEDKRKMENEVNVLKNDVDSTATQFKNGIEIFETQLNEMAEKNENLEQELNELKNHVVTTNDGYKKLEETLNHLKDRNVTTDSALKNQVQTLVNSLAEAENTNSEMAERNRKLDEDKRKMEKEMNVLKNDVDSTATQFEKQLNEMAEKNGNLEQELSEWKEMEQKARDGCKESEEQLTLLKDRNVTTDSALKNQVRMLVTSLAEAEEMNSGMAERNTKLENELESAKRMLSDIPSSSSGLHLPESSSLPKSEGATKPVMTSEEANSKASLETFEKRDTSKYDQEIEDIRINLLQHKFGWIKFHAFKNSRWFPGFEYPPNTEGARPEAQKILPNGEICIKTKVYVEFEENIDDDEKLTLEKTSLRKFNEKYKFSFV